MDDIYKNQRPVPMN